MSLTPGKRIQRNKINFKSLATSPPIKYPIPNQDSKLVLQKYQCLPSHLPPFPPVFKSLINKANDDNPETTDTSRTDKDDTSHTHRYYSIENVKEMKKNNDDDEYKEDNSQHQYGNEIFINTTK